MAVLHLRLRACLCVTFLACVSPIREKGPSHASWGQVRTPWGAPFSRRGGLRGRGRPPALLGNSLGLIGAWLVSHVSTYWRRRRIPLPGLWELLQAQAFPLRLHQHNHTEVNSQSKAWHDSMTEWCGLGCFRAVRSDTELYIVFLKEYMTLMLGTVCSKDLLSVQFTFLSILLFSLNSFWVRPYETSPLNCTVYHIPLLTHTKTSTSQKNTVFSCAYSAVRNTRSEEQHRWWKTKTSLLLLLLLPHHHTFSNFFSLFFFFSCRGNVPLISHQSRSPPWPCSVILKKTSLSSCYTAAVQKYWLSAAVQKWARAISHPTKLY